MSSNAHVRIWHLLALSFCALLARCAFYGDYIGHDDAYIYFRYAENIAHCKGWSFNPGEPTYGTTSPLWTLVLAAGEALGVGAQAVGVGVSLAALAALVIAAFYLGRTIFESDVSAFAYAAAVSFDPWILRWSGTIMETSLAAFAVVAFVLAARKLGRKSSLSVMGGVMYLIRPETGLVWAGTMLFPRPREIVKNAAFFALPVLPWVAFAAAAFGRVLPNTLIKAQAPLLHLSLRTAIQIGKVLSVYIPLTALAAASLSKKSWPRIKEILPEVITAALFVFYYIWRTYGLQSAARYMAPIGGLLSSLQLQRRSRER